MKEKRKFILIIIAFILLCFFINFFCLSSIFNSLNLQRGIVFYTLLFLLSFSYPLTVIFERYKPMFLTKIFYMVASTWIGIAFFSTIIFLIYGLLALLFTFNRQIGSAIVLYFITVISSIAFINGKRLKINRVNIKIKGLKKEMSMVHLTDLHLGAIHQKKYLEKIVKKTNSLNPDVVVITGDLVDVSSRINSNFLSPINKIKSPIYFVVGNHEIYEGLEKLFPIFKKTKMNIIRNGKSKFNSIAFIGVDYSESKKEIIDRLDKIKIDKNGVNILLYHAPRFKLEELEKMGINLHLAGHTHNGQIFPLNLFVKFLYPYATGFHKSEKSNLFVSAGSGTWGPPMRLGSTNEINLINLKKG